MDDHNKVRVYWCGCGGRCVRPLHGEPKPCDKCLADLSGRPWTVEDHGVFVRTLLEEARAKGGK